MSVVLSYDGERRLLSAAIGKQPATAWSVRLFVNPHAPTPPDAIDVFSEAAGGGYAPVALSTDGWVLTADAPAEALHPPVSFRFSGPLETNPTIYGYYVTAADGGWLFADVLVAPFTPANAGDALDLAPALTLGSRAPETDAS